MKHIDKQDDSRNELWDPKVQDRVFRRKYNFELKTNTRYAGHLMKKDQDPPQKALLRFKDLTRKVGERMMWPVIARTLGSEIVQTVLGIQNNVKIFFNKPKPNFKKIKINQWHDNP
jgi:hypothetical protein